MKFGYVLFEICEQTDIHTDTLIAILTNYVKYTMPNGVRSCKHDRRGAGSVLGSVGLVVLGL